MYPDYQQFQELATTNEGKMIPVSLEIEGDLDTPIRLFRKLCPNGSRFLLESVEGGERWARYSYIGFQPMLTISAQGQRVEITNEGTKERVVKTGNSIGIIQEVLADFQVCSLPDLPDFTGGAVGSISYDLIRQYENLPDNNPDDLELPEAHLLVVGEVIVYDHMRQKIKIIVNANPRHTDLATAYDHAVNRIRTLQEQIAAPEQAVSLPRANFASQKAAEHATETKASFMEKVRQAKEYIRNGDIFQVVLSQRLGIPINSDPFAIYRTLRSLNPSPYLFFIDFEQYQLVGASPELLVKVTDGRLETCPIAGTRPRGRTAEEDQALAEELLHDEKELAEHLMLVDLGRNDLGKVAEFGSVEVSNLMHIEKYSHVMHIVTNVAADLAPAHDMFDALRACLPAGTVSGAPKIRAMELIDQFETTRRGVYSGATGYFGFGGNMDLCIAIRTIVCKDHMAYVQAGAGIVADSKPENEYEETLRKARGLVTAIEQAEAAFSRGVQQ